ncbi:MAG: hypothetical protein JXO22_10510, partial [Phycisphaerae bacterium]|nr:hypothetical protein [Phycisphaerae bacterium]
VARARLFRDIVGLLLKEKRYADIANGPRTAEEMVTLLIQVCHETEREYKDIENSPASYMRRRVLRDGGQFYEALVGAQQAEQAAKLADQIIEFEPAGTTVAVLVGHAVAAGDKETARALAARAMKLLPESEHYAIEEAALDIPE